MTLPRIRHGRTDLVFEHIATGGNATDCDADGVSLIRWCAYYGDASAIRFLLLHGESISSLGDNFDLHGASFHGHWQLCQFLLECGADSKFALSDTGETALHAAMCRLDSIRQDRVVRVLVEAGADPNAPTRAGVTTGCFMRDCRTKAETPLHRAAAFASPETITLLLDAGAALDARDVNGDTPLAWASWHRRPVEVLRLLCYGQHRIHPDYVGMDVNLVGNPRH